MIGVFIPSYNRAMQCHALLESLLLRDQNALLKNINVYYQGSKPEFQEGYQKLTQNKDFKNINFKPKTSKGLAGDMLEVMADTKYKYFAVITDDCLFYRNFDLLYNELDEMMGSLVNHFTFRCGMNTNVIDYTNPSQKHYLNGRQYKNIIIFTWYEHTNHYGFPCALDGTLFNREFIFAKTMEACGPNFDYRSWECKVNTHLHNRKERPYGLCFDDSVLVNSPNNMVVENLYCQNGVHHKYTVEELNQKYLDGEKIDILKINQDSIVSVQQEISFTFKKNG